LLWASGVYVSARCEKRKSADGFSAVANNNINVYMKTAASVPHFVKGKKLYAPFIGTYRKKMGIFFIIKKITV
jgi:hypothetical protein